MVVHWDRRIHSIGIGSVSNRPPSFPSSLSFYAAATAVGGNHVSLQQCLRSLPENRGRSRARHRGPQAARRLPAKTGSLLASRRTGGQQGHRVRVRAYARHRRDQRGFNGTEPGRPGRVPLRRATENTVPKPGVLARREGLADPERLDGDGELLPRPICAVTKTPKQTSPVDGGGK